MLEKCHFPIKNVDWFNIFKWNKYVLEVVFTQQSGNKKEQLMTLRLIQGGRQLLEESILEKVALGTVCVEELDRLRPWGKLCLVSSTPIDAEQELADWLSFEDLSL